MLTGMLAVRKLLYGEDHDLWAVNTEQVYHEEIQSDEETDYKVDDSQSGSKRQSNDIESANVS